MEKKNIKKSILLGLIFGLIIGVIGTVSYAAYTYSKTGGETSQLVAGEIYMRYREGSTINLSGAMPSATYPTKANGNYFQFQIIGKNTNTEGDIKYNLKLAYGDNDTNGKVRINDQYLLFKLVKVNNLGEQNENEEILVNDANYSSIPNSLLYTATVPKNTTVETTTTYRLYARISESVGIGTNTTYTIEAWNNLYASIKINAEGEYDGIINESQLITNLIANNTVTTTGTTRYITGESDNNYVWYSGRMWRIVCYDIDANDNISNIKLVTQDALTTIFYGATNDSTGASFSNSYVKTWLNEDFYDSLYQPANFINTTATWNDGSANTTVPVGLLSYTDYNTVRNGSNTNYLNIGYDWWLITKSGSFVNDDGYLRNNSSSSFAYGVRPSIYLKSGLTFTGSGTITDPFMLKGDKATGATGNDLNTRTVGEYVRFKNTLFRIVGIENNNTKLVSVDYANINGTYFNKYFAASNSTTFGSSINSGNNNYSDYYLNNTWLDSLGLTTEQLRSNYLVKGTYYLGEYADGANYKTTICDSSDEENLNKKINGTDPCTRVSTIYNSGYVGLLRVGEMFSAQEGSGSGSSKNMWLITPNGSGVHGSGVRDVYSTGSLGSDSPSSFSIVVRPSIYLKSSITITGGSGLKNNPYTVE